MIEISIFRVLDKLESAIRKSPRIPLTNNILIDGEKLLGILGKMREGLPEEMKQARWVSKENQRILAEAQAKSETIILEAKDEAKRLVENSEIVRQAREDAEEINRGAINSAKALQARVNQYAREVLSGIESELGRIVDLVGKAKERMSTEESTINAPIVKETTSMESQQQMLVGG